MEKSRLPVLLWVFCVLVPFARSQESSFQVEVRLVQVEARVSKDGKPLKNLTRTDFQVFEDDVEQEIVFFHFVPSLSERVFAPVPTVAYQPDMLAPQKAGEPVVEPTWVYVASELANPNQLAKAVESIRQFIGEGLPPEFRISIGGLPFTNDVHLLEMTLDRMAESPYSSPNSINPALIQLEDDEFMRLVAKNQDFELALMDSMIGQDKEPKFDGAIDQAPLLSVEMIDRQIMFYGQLALFRYMDLVRLLSPLPGKKVVILLRSGLRYDTQNSETFRRFSSYSVKSRVSFYTIDARGLDPIEPINDRRFALPWHRGRQEAYYPNILAEHNRQMESKEGLILMARKTGGRSIVDNNDLRAVFDAVVEDSGDYYVLGYYPKDLDERGSFRQIEVKVEAPGAKVLSTPGYYESKQLSRQTKTERSLSLRQALEGGVRDTFPLSANLCIFAQKDRRPVLIYSIGTALSRLSAGKEKKHAAIEASILTQISDGVFRRMPLYYEQKLEHEISWEEWERANRDETVFMSYNSISLLNPGTYKWQCVLRDDRSGAVGLGKVKFQVPDFRHPSIPSGLLLTRSIQRLDNPDNGASEVDDVLAAGGLRYNPQPRNVFRKGEMIHLLYHLYQPTEDDLKSVRRGIQLAILSGGNPVDGVSAFGQAFIDHDETTVRFTAAIDSRSLEVGEYQVQAILPNYQTRDIPHLEANFLLLPALEQGLSRPSSIEPEQSVTISTGDQN